MSLHINSRYVLLTYAQCGDLDAFAVMERLSDLGAECIIGREHHETGGLHLHVFCDFGRKFRSRKADIFDVHGRHPNVSPSKGTPEQGRQYAIKDGDIVCGGLIDPIIVSGVRDGSSRDSWTQITSAPDRESFWELCHALDPKAAATSFSALSKYCDWKYAVAVPEYSHPAGLRFKSGASDGRDQWLLQSGIGSGEPRVGKISYTSACSVGGGSP